MAGPFDDVQMAIRNFLRHFFRHPKGKASIGIAVPQANRHPQFTQRKSPRLSKQLRIRQDACGRGRSEEHTSELQSPCNLVCRLLLEKKKKKKKKYDDNKKKKKKERKKKKKEKT